MFVVGPSSCLLLAVIVTLIHNVHITYSKVWGRHPSVTSPSQSAFCSNSASTNYISRRICSPILCATKPKQSGSDDDIESRVRDRVKNLLKENVATKNDADGNTPGSKKEGGKARLARATAALIAKRKEEEESLSSSTSSQSTSSSQSTTTNNYYATTDEEDNAEESNYDLLDLTKKIDRKILANNWRNSGQRRRLNVQEKNLQHNTDSMQSLLGYNHFEGEWSDRNCTTFHVAIVFGKSLINDQVTIEYATRLRTLAKMLRDEPSFHPSLICFTGGVSGDNAISDAAAGYVYFRHLCDIQNITIDDSFTKIWVDDNKLDGGGDERGALERISSELWRNNIKQWLKERPLTERVNQHYGVGWTIMERKVDIHFTLISTEYHLCNFNDVHHRSPGKSFLQPLVSLRGLVGSDRWQNIEELEVMDPNYSASVHVRSNNDATPARDRANFGGIENSVDTSWSFQYGTYPFLHGEEDALVFLGQCFLLGEELTPLLVNMRGVVEQVSRYIRCCIPNPHQLHILIQIFSLNPFLPN